MPKTESITVAATTLPDTEEVGRLRELVGAGRLRSRNPAIDGLIGKLTNSDIECGNFRQVDTTGPGGGGYTMYNDHKD